MRRNSQSSSSHDMQVNVAGIRRNIKNIAHNYSDAQKKVREATSNDPWGPSSTLMSEIADLTYNVVAFSEIMQMAWKRLNDHGRNWRHVYKTLVLLEYLIKTGSEKVAQQCKENIFAIQTLKDFQHLEEGKDQGQNVREKSKQLVQLLKDEERLKVERGRALKAKERFAQSATGFGGGSGSGDLATPTSPHFGGSFGGSGHGFGSGGDLPREIEIARPQTAGEEELQLQLALAMSREEAEQEEQKRKSDDVRLQLALSQSQQDFKEKVPAPNSHLMDLLDVGLEQPAPAVDPWGMQKPAPSAASNAWQLPPPQSGPAPAAVVDPWAPAPLAQKPPPVAVDPWAQSGDPWSPAQSTGTPDLDEFDVISNRNKTNGNNGGVAPIQPTARDPFEVDLLDALTLQEDTPPKRTPHSFLGENSALVNLDNLVTATKAQNPTLGTNNPFSEVSATPRPFGAVTAPLKPTINDLKQQSFAPFGVGGAGGFNGNAPANQTVDPWAPAPPTNNSHMNSPFLS